MQFSHINDKYQDVKFYFMIDFDKHVIKANASKIDQYSCVNILTKYGIGSTNIKLKYEL